MTESPGDYATLLRNAYLDEVRGAAYFGALAQEQPDAKRREKLETLQTVEARTVTTMDRLLGQVGLKVDTESRAQGRARARPNGSGRGLGRTDREPARHAAARATEVRAAPRPVEPARRPRDAGARQPRAGDRAVPRARSRRRRREVAAATHRPPAEARVITPEGRAYCGEQVSLDLHTVDAGTTEEIWAPPGEEAVIVLLEGDVEWAGAHAVRRSVFEDRASAVYLPSGTAVSVTRSDADGARPRRDARCRHHRAASRADRRRRGRDRRPRTRRTGVATPGARPRRGRGAGRAPARRRDVHARRAVVVVPAPQARRTRRRTRARRGVLLPMRPA